MRHIIISGAPSTGKSTLIQELSRRYPIIQEQCICIQDGGRWWMEEYEKKVGRKIRIDDLSREERSQMQWDIFQYYNTLVARAEREQKTIITDAFYAEIYTYSKNYLTEQQLETIASKMNLYRSGVDVIVLPMIQIPLELDGLRHEDESFRERAELDILSTYRRHRIPYVELHISDLEERIHYLARLMKFAT